MKNVMKKIVILGLALGFAKEGISGRVWGDHGSLVATNMYLVQPALCLLGERGMAAAFPCFDEDGVYRVAVQGLDPDGLLLFEAGPLFISSSEKWVYRNNTLIADSDNEGGVFLIWQALTEIEGQYDVYAQHFDANLRPTWDEGGVLLYRTNTYIQASSVKNYCGVLVSDEDGLIIVDRREVEEGNRGYNYLFYVRKFDADGTPTEGWHEEGELLFEMTSDVQFYQDPGRGLWCFGRDQRNRAALRVNLIQPDGTRRYEEAIQPELPEHGVVDNFTPDRTGGFYLALWELGGGNFCNAGVQRYDEDGRPVWDEWDIWFFRVERSHKDLIPIASENGSRLFCFVYDEVGEESPFDTRIYWIDPQGDRPRLLWDDPIFLDNCLVEPFFFMGDGDLLLNVMHHEWNEERENWIMERSEANIVSPGGRLLWEEGTAPIETHGKAVAIDWESFYVTTEILTSDDTNELRIDYLNIFAEREWGEEAQVYLMPQFGVLKTTQLLPGELVRFVSGSWKYQTPLDTILRQQIINPDGSLRYTILGQAFFELEERALGATSNGALIFIRYFGPNWEPDYRDVSIFDDQGVLHPNEPLPIDDLIGNGRFRDVYGDSVGGAFLVFRTGAENDYRSNIVRVNEVCERYGEILRPFDHPGFGDPVITPDGSGAAWVTVCISDEYYLIQKISAENELVWDEPRRWDSPYLRRSPIWLSTPDSSLVLVHQNRSNNLDSSNVRIWRFDTNGVQSWDEPVSAFEPNAGFEHPNLRYKAIANSLGGIWLVVWESRTSPPVETGIRLQLISFEGERLLGDQGIALPDMGRPASGSPAPPQLLGDDHGGVWVFTQAIELEPEGLRAFHFNREGELIDDREQPDPNGTAVITQVADGMRTGYIYPPWRYENGDVGVVFWYGYSARAQRISDRSNNAPQRESAPLERFEITSVYPSPSNDRVTVIYRLYRTGRIDLTLVDLNGRQVGLIYTGEQTAGEHQVSLSTGELASGAYVIQLKAFGESRQKMMIDLK